MHNEKGFSLIELLIVVTIILIIAAIAIPNLMKAKISANEASAVSSLRQIKTAEVAYSNMFSTVGYAPALINLGCAGLCPNPPTPAQSGFLDNSLAAGTKSGFTFAATGIALGGVNSDFVVGAVPMSPGVSGDRDFCSTADAVLRYQTAAGGPPPNSVAACTAFPGILQ